MHLYLLLITYTLCQLKIISPSALAANYREFEEGATWGSTAVFGTPDYGKKLMGKIYYSPPSNDDKPHCTLKGYDLPGIHKDGEGRLYDEKNIVLVRRGGCSFVQKTRVAQSKGADAVVVVDYDCPTQKKMFIDESGKTPPDWTCRDSFDIQHIIVDDDGTSSDINIPTLLIANSPGEAIITEIIREKTTVVASLLWDMPSRHYVNMDAWLSSSSLETNYFLSEFSDKIQKLQYSVQFTPHYSMYVMNISSMAKNEGKSRADSLSKIIESECLPHVPEVGVAKGVDDLYFCALENAGRVSGRQVVLENLRQWCLWQSSKEFTNPFGISRKGDHISYSPLYWVYVKLFFEQCHPLNSRTKSSFSVECSNRVLSMARKILPLATFNEKGYDYCVKHFVHPKCADTGGMEFHSICRHDFLVDAVQNLAPWSNNAIRINGWRYSGPSDGHSLALTICSGFDEPPSVCDEILIENKRMFFSYIAAGITSFWGKLTFLLLSLAFLPLLWIYRLYLKRSVSDKIRQEVMLEVRSQMTDYALMEDMGSTSLMGTREVEMVPVR